MKPIQDIRPGKRLPRKTVVIVEEEPLDRAGFTAKIAELSDRLNYEDKLTAKERFLRAVRRLSK
jgi:hypothetical protein